MSKKPRGSNNACSKHQQNNTTKGGGGPAIEAGAATSLPQETNPPGTPVETDQEIDKGPSRSSSFVSADYHYPAGLPAAEPADVRIIYKKIPAEETEAEQEERERKLEEAVQEMTPKMEAHLKAYLTSRRGKGLIKKTIVSKFFEGKGIPEEEIAKIADGFDDKKFQENLIPRIIDRVFMVFKRDKVDDSQIVEKVKKDDNGVDREEKELSGYAKGILHLLLNGIVDEECRRILANKGMYKATVKGSENEEKFKEIMEKIFKNPENKRKIDSIGNDIREKMYKVWQKSSENWPGFSEKDKQQRIAIDARAAINISADAILGSIFKEIKAEDEKKETKEFLVEYLSKIVLEENKKS